MTERFRVRSAPLAGRGPWLNTGGRDLSLAELRGKIVILDFWTFCCVNCLHVLDELRELEHKYADVLVVIGVHSPKFAHEAEAAAVAAAVERYEVEHPVWNDPDLATWQAYGVRAWPTLAVIDPEGYVVAQHSGEGHAHALDVLIAELVAEHSAKGTLHRGDGPYVAPPPTAGVLRFPAKAAGLPDGRLLVADAGHHRVVLLDPAGEQLVSVFGAGRRGWQDGTTAAEFCEPNGVCLLPPAVAEVVGYDAVVADTVNHCLRGLRLADGEVTTVAGTGEQWMQGDGPGLQPAPARATRLSSPWDVVWWPAIGEVAVAMAGIHQIWAFHPVAGTVRVLAGTTNEGLVDGEGSAAWFAQTSGLAVSADGQELWLADSETSALRSISNSLVRTHIGAGLFDFGHVDGSAATARLQHPLGLTVLPDGSIAIADTYNNAVRHFDPVTREVATIARELAEPSGLLPVPNPAGGFDLLVVESAAHRLTRIALPERMQQVMGEALRTSRPAQEIAAGQLALEVRFQPPAGQKLDERYGPATYLIVSASPPELLAAGQGSGTELGRELLIADPEVTGVSSGVLHVSVRAASCDDSTAVEFPACHVHQQDWGVPVVIAPQGSSELRLLLAGI